MIFYPIVDNMLMASAPQAEVLSLDGTLLIPDPENVSNERLSGKNDHINPSKAEIVSYLTEIFGERLMPHFFAIFSCESSLRQFDSKGNPLLSSTKDVGIGQVNIPTWGDKAKELGLDIYNSWKDNVRMSKYVFDHQRATAWSCTSKI